MNKTIVIVTALAILILGGLFWIGRPRPQSDSGAPSASATMLLAEEKLFDFGTISMADGNVDHIFRIANPTDKDINLKSVSTSCMCTSAFIESPSGEKGPFGMQGMGYLPPANEIIKAGEFRNIKVVYDPNAHGPAGVGPVDRLIYLSDESGGTLKLEVRARVMP